MAILTSKKPSATYKSLLQIGTGDNQELDGTLRVVEDGAGNDSSLKLTVTGTAIGGSFVGKVGIGIDAPLGNLHIVKTTSTGLTPHSNGSTLVIDSKDDPAGISILSDSGEKAVIYFGDGASASAYIGQINYDHADNSMEFVTNGTEHMNIQSDGNVGIGITNPPKQLTIAGANTYATMALVNTDANNTISDGVDLGRIYFGGDDPTDNTYQYGAIIQAEAAGDWSGTTDSPSRLQFLTAADGATTAVKMTLDEDGNVGIGATSPTYPLEVVGKGTDDYIALFDNPGTSSADNGIRIKCGDTDHSGDSNTKYIDFQESDGGSSGGIQVSGGNIALYNTSDERLKENIRDTAFKGLETIDKLRMVDFEWISSKNSIECGLIAQELLAVLPQAVVKPSAGDDYYHIRKTDFIYMLLKGVQELSAKVTALENA